MKNQNMYTTINEFKKYYMINESLSITNVMTHARKIADTILDNLTDEDKDFIENHKEEVLGKIKGDPLQALNKLENELNTLNPDKLKKIDNLTTELSEKFVNEGLFSKNSKSPFLYWVKTIGSYLTAVFGIVSAIASIATTTSTWMNSPFLAMLRDLITEYVGHNAGGPIGFLLLGISMALIFIGSTVKKPTLEK